MITGPDIKATYIYTRKPRKCGISTLTVESLINSNLASEEGVARIVSLLCLVILMDIVFYIKSKIDNFNRR